MGQKAVFRGEQLVSACFFDQPGLKKLRQGGKYRVGVKYPSRRMRK